MDILGKAVSKVGSAATQAAAAAAQMRRLDGEQRALANLRAQALSLRAQIGEEMYKLWQQGSLPPSSLDHLFRAVESTMAAIEAQRAVVEELKAQLRTGGGTAANQGDGAPADDLQGVALALPPPPVPAAPTRRLAPAQLPGPADEVGPDAGKGPCPTCGATLTPGKPYCGFCGTRLG